MSMREQNCNFLQRCNCNQLPSPYNFRQFPALNKKALDITRGTNTW